MRLLTVGLDDTFHFDTHVVDVAKDDEDAISMLALYEFDCAIVNIISVGVFFAHRIREKNIRVPLIMLDSIHDASLRCGMLEKGADFCMTVPLDRRELESNIQALVRRCNRSSLNSEIKIGDITIDTDNRVVSVFKGLKVHMTNREYEVLHLLASRQNRLVTKQAFIERTYADRNKIPEEKIMDVFVCKIRKKLSMLSYDPIETVWGKGFRIYIPTTEERKVAS